MCRGDEFLGANIFAPSLVQHSCTYHIHIRQQNKKHWNTGFHYCHCYWRVSFFADLFRGSWFFFRFTTYQLSTFGAAQRRRWRHQLFPTSLWSLDLHLHFPWWAIVVLPNFPLLLQLFWLPQNLLRTDKLRVRLCHQLVSRRFSPACFLHKKICFLPFTLDCTNKLCRCVCCCFI